MMRTSVFKVAVLAVTVSALAAIHPDLPQVRNVYLLPMAQGLDQYIANHLTRTQMFQVVTDPAKADAVFTEMLGKDFEQRMEIIYPSPEKLKAEKERAEKAKAEREKSDKDKDKDKAKAGDKDKTPEPMVERRDDSTYMRSSSFNRGRGNVFVVDIKSRRVLWSYHHRPKNSSPPEIDKAADEIVDQLGKDLKPPKPAKQN